MRIKSEEERFDEIMKRSHPNLNHPLLYKHGAMPPQVLFSHHINHLLRIKPSDSSECFPSEGTLSPSFSLSTPSHDLGPLANETNHPPFPGDSSEFWRWWISAMNILKRQPQFRQRSSNFTAILWKLWNDRNLWIFEGVAPLQYLLASSLAYDAEDKAEKATSATPLFFSYTRASISDCINTNSVVATDIVISSCILTPFNSYFAATALLHRGCGALPYS
ncbi:hypothetical protein PIB30_018619 [Stylosanthes scabra]|uniref:Aminotransferase-like plant mobile domain-containing protein n=1 Tax=Stylosanthes scabra TaxID=79078 RepID=A0ABU6T7Q7_9FABA|nr:hypothetical protein [Stylosanthes scabra]